MNPTRPNRFKKDTDPVSMEGLVSGDDVASMTAIQRESQLLRTENEYLEGKLNEQQITIDALSDELEKLVVSEANLDVEKEQFREDNKTLLDIIDQLNIELGELKKPKNLSTGSRGPIGMTGPQGQTGVSGALYG